MQGSYYDSMAGRGLCIISVQDSIDTAWLVLSTTRL